MIRIHSVPTLLAFSVQCFHIALLLVSLVTAATSVSRKGCKTILPTCVAATNSEGVYGNLMRRRRWAHRYNHFSPICISFVRIFEEMNDDDWFVSYKPAWMYIIIMFIIVECSKSSKYSNISLNLLITC